MNERLGAEAEDEGCEADFGTGLGSGCTVRFGMLGTRLRRRLLRVARRGGIGGWRRRWALFDVFARLTGGREPPPILHFEGRLAPALVILHGAAYRVSTIKPWSSSATAGYALRAADGSRTVARTRIP